MKQIVTLENISCQNCVKHVTDHTYSAEDYQAALAKTIYKVVNVA